MNVKAIFVLLILITPVLYGLNLFFESPYRLYNSFLEEGVDSSFLKITRPDIRLLEVKNISDYDNTIKDDDKLWEEVEVDRFVLPFAKYHPSFTTIPNPSNDNKKINTDVLYQQSNREDIIEFKQLDSGKIDLSLPPEKLFRIPLVRKYILSKPRSQIWDDIFSKNLNKQFSFSYFLNVTVKKWDIFNPLDLAYNIFIYKMRTKIFIKDFDWIFRVSNSHAVYVKAGKTENIKYYYGQIYKQGKLLNYEIKSYKNNQYSTLILTRIFNTIDLVETAPKELSVKYYTKFRSLSYKDRLSNEGLGYLYASWSHDKKNSAYIREIIQFFERDPSFAQALQPFYTLSRNMWGTNYSKKDKYLDEDAQIKLSRKIEEEKRQEEMELGNFDIQDIETMPRDEKIKYLLKKGKKNKIKTKNKLIEN